MPPATPAPPGTRPPGRPTLRDVARALGVSVATVSNAYNRPDQLSEELRERILQTARDLGYHGPDPLARSLRRGRTGVLGVVYDAPLEYAFADPAAALFLGSVTRAVQDDHLNVLLLASPHGPGADPTGPVRSASVDGFIVYCAAEGSALLQAVLDRHLPTVLVDQAPHPGTVTVDIDDAGGAQQAARHLLDLGHRQIGVLCLELNATRHAGPVTPAREAQLSYRTTAERLRGYRAAAAAVPGATLHPTEVEQNTPQEGERRALDLLAAYPDLTALLCMSDVLAQGALRAAAQLGRRVPEDLSVIGYDDLPSSSPLNLTTVWQPTPDKGAGVGHAILALLRGETPPALTLPTRLITRGTTAPPSARSLTPPCT
ncbi:LacI family DNA-binding transcriptional regulator [Deinococcus taeanensis]|uniref:LacI family DNA-binding transcriptional regulator n=1 Tax=Deinococcus taeanensis TaxID=2737050 RepID=UPI001CDCE17A|nr:LacI family DNA-binding transcriptional regulator [Deinococcus taeanensis]UBV42621.1 LacI family DNA-binding transcriptional regulator [Deinococcus taeanensis]